MTEFTNVCSLEEELSILRKIFSIEIGDASKDIKNSEKNLFKIQKQFVTGWRNYQKNPELSLDSFLEICKKMVNQISKINQNYDEFEKSTKSSMKEIKDLKNKINRISSQISNEKRDKK